MELWIFIVLAITILLLAYMAGILKIEFNWPEGQKLPSVSINFEKDPSFLGFLNRKSLKKNSIHSYEIKDLFCQCSIQYGQNKFSIAKKLFKIIPKIKSLDEFILYIADADFEIMPGNGFKKNEYPKKFEAIRSLKNWDRTEGIGPFANLFSIPLEIPLTIKDQECEVEITYRGKVHYEELVANRELVSHFFYFRIEANTENAVLTFNIPLGEKSSIKYFDLIKEYKGDAFFHREKIAPNQQIIEIGKKESVLINKEKNLLTVTWTILGNLIEGEIYKLKWFTEPLNKT